MFKFKFADIGEGLHEGVVAEVYKNVGDIVKEGDPLFSVETDKVTSDIPSPADGKISKILMKEGDTINVGDEIYYIDDGKSNSESVESPKEEKEDSSVDSSTIKPIIVKETKIGNVLPDQNSNNSNLTPRMIHINKLLGKDSNVSPKKLLGKDCKTPEVQKLPSNINSGKRVEISPLAKAIALDHNIEYSNIIGSGLNSRIMKEDILKVINNPSSVEINKEKVVPKENISIIKEDKRVKVTNLRKTIAKVMKNSWDTVAYTNLFTKIDMTKLWDFRSKIKDKVFKKTGIKITFLAFIVKALAIAIKKYPNMNAIYDDKTSELVYKANFNAGIAVDTKAGLVVPVVKNADDISILKIAKEIIRLGGAARDGKLTKNDMSEGTFSITNYGSFGALGGVPVINYPQLALAGVGGIIDEVALINNQVSPRKIMLLTVAADHRWIDGGDIAKFARDVKELLEEPAMLWIESEMNNV